MEEKEMRLGPALREERGGRGRRWGERGAERGRAVGTGGGTRRGNYCTLGRHC